MSNVVMSQPRLEAKINNSKEPPPSEMNCEKCREDDDQCCFVYFYSLYCSRCRCSGCCDDEKQKRRRPRRGVNKYYSNDTMFDDDLYVTRGFLNDENDFIHTHNDYGPSEVTNKYDKATNNSLGHAEVEGHSRDSYTGMGGDSGEVCASGASGDHSADGDQSGGPSEGASHSHVNNGGGDLTVSVGVCPSGTATGSYSGGHSESGVHPSGNTVSVGHSLGDTGGGYDSDGHCVSVDDSGGNSGGGDTGADCGGDTGGDYGGGDTGGDCGGGGND